MKHIIRNIIMSIGGIYLLTLINPGFYYENGYQTLLLAGFVMFFLDTIVEPLLNIVFLPINFLTAGLFKWVVGVALIYALIYFVPALHVNPWVFNGYTLQIPRLPAFQLPAYSFNFWTNLILVSFSFNLVVGIMRWIIED